MKTSRKTSSLLPDQRRLLIMVLVAGSYALACDLPTQRQLSGLELTATYDALAVSVLAMDRAANGGSPTGPAGGSPTDTAPANTAPANTARPTNTSPPTKTIVPPPTVPGAPAVTALDNANVREGPSVNFKVVGALLKG
jgi:hypothetical protein